MPSAKSLKRSPKRKPRELPADMPRIIEAKSPLEIAGAKRIATLPWGVHR
jgi:hypothetical protein